MTPPANEAQAFGFRLRKLIPEGQVRATARLLDPKDPDRGKRNLNRWLAGKVLPSSRSRDRLCQVLEVGRDELPLPSDEEEEDSVSALTRDLYRRIDKLVEARVKEALHP